MLSRSLLTILGALGYLSQGTNAESHGNADTRDLSRRFDNSQPTTLSTAIVPTATASLETGVGFWPAYTPEKDQNVKFGDSLKITWGYDPRWDGKLKITLIGGAVQEKQTDLGVIAEHVENKQGYYIWNVTNEFVGKHAVYGFSVLYQDGKTQQYSMRFHIV
ncbi:unnamed protein product [Clonostachys rhizophaga]|uniref:Yeast cell wall synthesis Kre9/Knh1-like N-terminal domain-containing protein n=1 Tax=Clonostachys rhizophaga TaxID=160324 RepID=A0A9N9VF92_9HYPO|nr:unnamed protein product [Clonostachys rhizophaga]